MLLPIHIRYGGLKLVRSAKMSEEVFIALLVGLLGICSCSHGDAFGLVGISTRCCLPSLKFQVSGRESCMLSAIGFHLFHTFPIQSLIRLLWISHRGHRRSLSLAARRGTPASAAHRAAPASAAHCGPGGAGRRAIGSSPAAARMASSDYGAFGSHRLLRRFGPG